ncbi:hypothetical protein [Paenibacillus sp. FSL W7-1287]|uniref:hypothetical protein n=1 Tax=Paenibacillus sp. FSL W7-1287 TaxID=2954538 RepID=UPI0030F81000
MDELRGNRNSFVLSNGLSTKSLYLNLGMMLVLLCFYATSIFYEIPILVKVMSLLIFLTLALFSIREVFKSTMLIVENNRLLMGIDEIKASEVEEIIYNSWIIYIKRRNRSTLRKYVTISLRDNKEIEHLKCILNEFGKSNDIKVRKAL